MTPHGAYPAASAALVSPGAFRQVSLLLLIFLAGSGGINLSSLEIPRQPSDIHKNCSPRFWFGYDIHFEPCENNQAASVHGNATDAPSPRDDEMTGHKKVGDMVYCGPDLLGPSILRERGWDGVP